jgi:hypothetical protein
MAQTAVFHSDRREGVFVGWALIEVLSPRPEGAHSHQPRAPPFSFLA